MSCADNRFITRSGRLYETIGEPRFNTDADYVWQSWLYIHKLELTDIEDISDLFYNNTEEYQF
jgi:hypothetical protein